MKNKINTLSPLEKEVYNYLKLFAPITIFEISLEKGESYVGALGKLVSKGLIEIKPTRKIFPEYGKIAKKLVKVIEENNNNNTRERV